MSEHADVQLDLFPPNYDALIQDIELAQTIAIAMHPYMSEAAELNIQRELIRPRNIHPTTKWARRPRNDELRVQHQQFWSLGLLVVNLKKKANKAAEAAL